MIPLRAFGSAFFIAVLASSAQAQTPATPEQKPSMDELLRRIDALQRRTAEGDKLISALQHRVEELESRDRQAKSQATTARREPSAAQRPPPQVAVASVQPTLTANAAVPPSPIWPHFPEQDVPPNAGPGDVLPLDCRQLHLLP